MSWVHSLIVNYLSSDCPALLWCSGLTDIFSAWLYCEVVWRWTSIKVWITKRNCSFSGIGRKEASFHCKFISSSNERVRLHFWTFNLHLKRGDCYFYQFVLCGGVEFDYKHSLCHNSCAIIAKDLQETRELYLTGQGSKDLLDGLCSLLRQCWDEDPMKRPTFANIIDCLEDILFRLEHKKLVRSNSFRFFPCMSLKQNPFYHA